MVQTDRQLQCVVVTPERALLDEAADFVALPMYDGELGVLPGRAPLIGRLGFGELRLRRENQVRRYYIDGGFAQVRDNIVTILTPQALKTEEINPEAVRQALEAARVPATTPDAQQSQYQAQQRARAQLRLAARPTEMEGH